MYKLRSVYLSEVFVGATRITNNADTIVKDLNEYHLQACSEGLISIEKFQTSIDPEECKDGKDGVGIASITLDSQQGLVDTYKIQLTNGNSTTFTVTNGKDGRDGANGTNGINGTNGKTAYELAVENGYTGTLQEWLEALSSSLPKGGETNQVLAKASNADNDFTWQTPITLETVQQEIKNQIKEHIIISSEAPTGNIAEGTIWCIINKE